MVLDQIGEPPRRRAVLRRDGPVGEPDAKERDPGPSTPRDGRVVVADPVVRSPPGERQDRSGETDGDPRQTPAPRGGRDERHEHGREQHLVRGPDEDEGRDAGAQHDEPRCVGATKRPREHERPERQAGGEHRVARGLVIDRRPSRIHQQQHRRSEGGNTSEGQRGRAPRNHRHGEEQTEDDLEQGASADIHRQPDSDRGEGRAEELQLGERRVGVEQLKVVGEVVPCVPTLRHRPARGPGTRTHRARPRRGRGQPSSSARTP